jgi:isopentenyl-diphosphate delta-isomerase
VREANEELNLDVNIKDIQCIARLTPSSHGVSAFMKVYEMRMDTVPEYNGCDFTEYYWLCPSEVLKRIVAGERAKNDLPKLVNILYPHA